MKRNNIWRSAAAATAAVPLILGAGPASAASIAPAVPETSLPCSGQHLSRCPLPGLYGPNPDPVIFNDKTHDYRIIWAASYVWAPPRGEVPQWFSVYVFYENYGKQTLSFACPAAGTGPGSIKEWFYRDGKNIGYVPASTNSCTHHANQKKTLNPGGIFQQTAKFHNVPWKGDKIAIEWPQNQNPTATSAFRNPYGIYRWAGPSRKPPKRRGISGLVKLEKLGGMVWQIVGVSNMVCEILHCKFAPPNVTKLISKVGDVQTIGGLANSIREAVVLGNDLSALNKAIKGHTQGKPYSAKVKRIAKATWNDARALQKTLEDLVPGLSLLWPVPPAK